MKSWPVKDVKNYVVMGKHGNLLILYGGKGLALFRARKDLPDKNKRVLYAAPDYKCAKQFIDSYNLL